DEVDGDGGEDVIWAGEGDDYTIDGDGNDQTFGGTGNDTLGGESGDDLVVGGTGADELWSDVERDAPAERNTLYGGAGDDTFYADGTGGYLDGGDGDDVLYVGHMPTYLSATDTWVPSAPRRADHATVVGGAGADTAVLPQGRADYTFTAGRHGALVIVETAAPAHRLTLREVELLWFRAGDRVAVPVAEVLAARPLAGVASATARAAPAKPGLGLLAALA
ncbi:MAG TPA: hypothetical protein VEB64_08465, partial [Azospirillaceae bacterium]|nr:hypothetical protein [Azospirillaceae bacterium]